MEQRSEKLRLATEMRVVKQENEKLKSELEQARVELGNFDDNFFDEIEDLKYNYAETVKKNVLYEDRLRHYSNLFGFDVDLPSGDD